MKSDKVTLIGSFIDFMTPTFFQLAVPVFTEGLQAYRWYCCTSFSSQLTSNSHRTSRPFPDLLNFNVGLGTDLDWRDVSTWFGKGGRSLSSWCSCCTEFKSRGSGILSWRWFAITWDAYWADSPLANGGLEEKNFCLSSVSSFCFGLRRTLIISLFWLFWTVLDGFSVF